MSLLRNLLFLLIVILVNACSDAPISSIESIENNDEKIFKSLDANKTGVDFSNTLSENDSVNYFTYPYIYMGGGVAVGDVNNDGNVDLYFTGNMVKNELYLGEGDGTFQNITDNAGVSSDDRWVTGVTMVDVNADGWLDIYVSVSGKWETTANQLFINQGKKAWQNDNTTKFIELGNQYGLADEGHTTQATFFDYDRDGDLDCFVANYPPTHFKTPNYTYQIAKAEKDPLLSDRLYANNGNGKFTDVTKEAGLLNHGLTLSATAADFNDDGWDDLYLSNDFASSDYFYFNNGDGTFSEKVKEAMQHTAFFGMGADAADINNDGLMDLIQMDMTPSDNRRNKANMASMNIPAFWEMVRMGLHYQYMQNTIQINKGITDDGTPRFSDISRMTGMSSTDWSWATLAADFDNDGWKDVLITNGTRRDINNKDYFNKIDKATYQEKQLFNDLDLTLNMPSESVTNYIFKNKGDLSFEDATEKWGFYDEGFSNGAAYADIDNDGDLDIIINNIDAPAQIFLNQSKDKNENHFISATLKGPENNPFGLGTKIKLFKENKIQYRQHQMTRGFQSAVSEVVHFGLGSDITIDSLIVVWPDGKIQKLNELNADQKITLSYKEASIPLQNIDELKNKSVTKLFADVTETSGINFKHEENPYDDYSKEILLPHRYSMNGPAVATGDVNGDGLDDIYLGGAQNQSGALYIQNKAGSFVRANLNPWSRDKIYEDIDAIFFDADGDNDQDLYVVSGGNENPPGASAYRDRLYLNDGKAQFSVAKNALPVIKESGSRVKAADFDNDGDMDLFVGGRLVPQQYPRPAKSTLLRNDGMQNGVPIFTDVTNKVAPKLNQIGLVTDALWSDFDVDGKLDLIVVGEWMPITFLKNTGGQFKDVTEQMGFENTTGWWFSLAAADFDKDGDLDIVAGNLGLNYKYQTDPSTTFDVYAKDFDNNGKLDIVLGYYADDGVQYPVRGRQCSAEQIPTIKYKYEDYNTFAAASLEDIYTEKDLEASLHYQAKTFASVYLENNGNGEFEIIQLPNEAQVSSINNILTDDYNLDGHADMLLTGNLFGSEVETTRNDASYGHLLLGDGTGQFEVTPYHTSGIMLGGDVKSMGAIRSSNGAYILIGNNNAAPTLLKYSVK